jgi:ankyrin repeat protein
VKVLIDAGADVNAKNKDGKTALMWAARYGHTEVAEILKQAGARE